MLLQAASEGKADPQSSSPNLHSANVAVMDGRAFLAGAIACSAAPLAAGAQASDESLLFRIGPSRRFPRGAAEASDRRTVVVREDRWRHSPLGRTRAVLC